MKKFTLLENFRYSDEEIEDFFIDYVDNKKFKLESGFLDTKENQFYLGVSNVSPKDRECKKITITIDNVATGIKSDKQEGRCVVNTDIITKILSSIKTFYARSYEDINFIINNQYDDIEVIFFITGDVINKSHLDKKEEIKTLLSELVLIIKARGYKKVSLKGANFLEVITPRNSSDDITLSSTLKRASENNLDATDRNQPLINWMNKISQLNYRMETGGGNDQVVIKLRN